MAWNPLHVPGHPFRLFTDFVENFQDRDVHSERQVILSDFSDTTLLNVIRTQGWESLCEKPVRCPIVFMQEFYSNIHGIDTSMPQFTTQFRGTRLGAIPVSKILNKGVQIGPKLKMAQMLSPARKLPD